MNGKSKCKILKDIRRQIAQENDIALVISECKYQGDCTGTCPKCEAEVRYLEQELRKRQLSGKAVAVAGIAAALMVSAAGCTLPQDKKVTLPSTSYFATDPTTVPGTDLMGVPALPSEVPGGIALPETTAGEIPEPPETTASEDEYWGDPLPEGDY